eukprot:8164-Heterococcus_DN1.PRE.19
MSWGHGGVALKLNHLLSSARSRACTAALQISMLGFPKGARSTLFEAAKTVHRCKDSLLSRHQQQHGNRTEHDRRDHWTYPHSCRPCIWWSTTLLRELTNAVCSRACITAVLAKPSHSSVVLTTAGNITIPQSSYCSKGACQLLTDGLTGNAVVDSSPGCLILHQNVRCQQYRCRFNTGLG